MTGCAAADFRSIGPSKKFLGSPLKVMEARLLVTQLGHVHCLQYSLDGESRQSFNKLLSN